MNSSSRSSIDEGAPGMGELAAVEPADGSCADDGVGEWSVGHGG